MDTVQIRFSLVKTKFMISLQTLSSTSFVYKNGDDFPNVCHSPSFLVGQGHRSFFPGPIITKADRPALVTDHLHDVFCVECDPVHLVLTTGSRRLLGRTIHEIPIEHVVRLPR